jgi:predicted ATP-grasp superfamily ATP-dependent carboligase
LQQLTNKQLLHGLAQALHIDQPWTFRPRDRAELETRDIVFPVIIKPTARESSNRLTEEKAWKVQDRDSLLNRYDQACRLVSPQGILIQELIPGRGEAQFSYAALCCKGRPVASLIARRTRQFPMEFGRFSTFVETVDEPQVIDPAVRLLSAVEFTGLVEVEFKRDARDGKYKLLDVNPRLWGWHTLGARAGVDFSYLLWQMLHGEPIPQTQARLGAQWIRMACDLPIVLSEILKGHLRLNDYLRTLACPTESALLSGDDPLPGLLEAPLLAYGMFKSLFRGAKK